MPFEEIVDRRTDDGQISIIIAHCLVKTFQMRGHNI